MLTEFIDPDSKKKLEKNFEGNFFAGNGKKRKLYMCYDGCYDFVEANANVKEMKHVYDELYAKGKNTRLSMAVVTNAWQDPIAPWLRTLLESLGPLSGKRILLVGNGDSYNEFYFLFQGATVVYTDFSIMAARWAQSIFRQSEFWEKYRDQIEFHAVDGSRMPFPDESFDIIFGKKCVGFIDDQAAFFSEVSRCLKPEGICRFVDDAYSPAWNAVRMLWRPVKVHILWKYMSPWSRVRSGGTPHGSFGFKKESLVPFIKQCGFSGMIFIRNYFFLRIAQFFWVKMFGWDAKKLRYAKPLFLSMKRVDNQLANTMWMKRNSLPVIFGFNK